MAAVTTGLNDDKRNNRSFYLFSSCIFWFSVQQWNARVLQTHTHTHTLQVNISRAPEMQLTPKHNGLESVLIIILSCHCCCCQRTGAGCRRCWLISIVFAICDIVLGVKKNIRLKWVRSLSTWRNCTNARMHSRTLRCFNFNIVESTRSYRIFVKKIISSLSRNPTRCIIANEWKTNGNLRNE